MVFTVAIAHAATAFDYNFHSWATEIMDLETVFLSVIPDHRKSRKCAPSWSREAPQIQEKIDKTSGPQCVRWVSLWTPGSPKWCPRDPKRSSEVSKIAGLGRSNIFFASS